MHTFYQFWHQVDGGTRHRVSVVTGGDDIAARAFLVARELGGLRDEEVSADPCVHFALPAELAPRGPVYGPGGSCWAGWRITDYVYGYGEGRGDRAPYDGVVFEPSPGLVKTREFDAKLACARLCTIRDMTTTELVAACSRAGMAMAGLKVMMAVRYLRHTHRIKLASDGRSWCAEVRLS